MKLAQIIKLLAYTVSRFSLIILTVAFYRWLMTSSACLDPEDCTDWTWRVWCASSFVVNAFVSVILPTQLENKIRYELAISIAFILFCIMAGASFFDNFVMEMPLDGTSPKEESFIYSFCGSATVFSILLGIPGCIWWLRIWFHMISPAKLHFLMRCARYVAGIYHLASPIPHPAAGVAASEPLKGEKKDASRKRESARRSASDASMDL